MQQQKDHRSKIGVRARVILSTFWRDGTMSDAEQALELEGWMDVLQTCSHSEIRGAWRDYQIDGPRTEMGVLKKPDAGAIYRLLMKSKPKLKIAVVNSAEPQRGPRCSKETAQEIMKTVGFRPKKFGG